MMLAATAKAADIIEQVNTDKAADIVTQVNDQKASDVLAEVEPTKAGAIMNEVPTVKVTEIVKLMDEDKLIERLPEMTADKLFDIPAAVLFENLPNVPASQLAIENPPDVDPDLPAPVAVQVTPTLALYTVPGTSDVLWTSLVASPSPIDAILGKFNKVLTDLEISVADLDAKPAGAPDLAANLKVNSFFSIDVQGATPDDVAAAHVTMFVEKAWVEANNVYKWSIQFNRLDEAQNQWVPFQTKRVREDDERIFYTLVVPGFSVIAVTGSVELPEQVFEVTGLRITPAAPKAEIDVTISADVTNNGSSAAVYPANLWINDTIEQTQTIQVGAGQTETVEFTINKPAGSYDIRVERLLGQLVVGVPPATPVPVVVTVADAAATPTATPTPAPTATTVAIATRVPTATPVPATPAPTATAPAVPSPTVVPALVAPTPTATPIPKEEEEDGGAGAVVIIIIVLVILAAIGGGLFVYLRQQGIIGGPPEPPSRGVPPGPGGPAEPETPTAEPEGPAPPEEPEEEAEEERPDVSPPTPPDIGQPTPPSEDDEEESSEEDSDKGDEEKRRE